MADAARFPQLAFPFAGVGAAAGWLSSSCIINVAVGFTHGPGFARFMPYQVTSTVCTALGGALTGLLLTRLCVGKRYDYELDDADPDRRPPTDTWPLHVGVILATGVAIGWVVTVALSAWSQLLEGVLAGAAGALAFVPVCLAVIAAARRAQRARLGSLVAHSDRRAVWGIMALALAVATLLAVPDWLALESVGRAPPLVALGILAVTCAATLAILRADRRALRSADAIIAAGLTTRDPDDREPDDGPITRLDLGVGDDLHAVTARGAAAYRQRERTVALVHGSADAALAALGRAVRRGAITLVIIGAVLTAHACAAAGSARWVAELARTAR